MNLEYRTIVAMVHLYCKKHHECRGRCCEACTELLEYAKQRIEKCPFGVEKPVCNQCTVHCYRPDLREKVREIMRFSGPRMLGRHPFLAVRHLLRSRRYSGIRSK